jgi:hypothetical protein
MDAVGVALEAAAGPFEEARDFVLRRQAIIVANPELQERELIKLAALAAALADALRRRGVPDPAASLAAEAGVAVFKVAFLRWAAQAAAGDGQTLAQVIDQSLTELKAVTAAG